MSSGHYCDGCHRNYQSCTCKSLEHTQAYDFLNGWSKAINHIYDPTYEDPPQEVFKARATKPAKEPTRSDTYGLPLDPHTTNTLGNSWVNSNYDKLLTEAQKHELAEAKKDINSKAATLLSERLSAAHKEQPYRFTDITRGNVEHLGPDLSGMPEHYPRKKVVGEQPLKYGWNDVNKFKPPSGKLQFYTIGGTCIYGDYVSMAPDFVTHWAYLLPSPSKQAGAIK
jgi:hypothetical protein